MKLKNLAVLSLAACACSLPLSAQEPASPLAIYYSFESAPPQQLMESMESEFSRILSPSGLNVAWREIDTEQSSTEIFREIVVIRFRGTCQFRPQDHFQSGFETGGLSLAETDLVNGRVLPFGEVQCDQLRSFLGAVSSSLSVENRNLALARAMARVGAHELYHMLTKSSSHSRTGIARAEHSRTELMAASFNFAKADEVWLHDWLRGQQFTQTSALNRAGRAPVYSGSAESSSFDVGDGN